MRRIGIAVLLVAGCRTASVPDPAAIEVRLPFPAGTTVRCGQGPRSTGTHATVDAWDLLAPEGTPFVAALRGRVIWVVDDSEATGRQSFDEANHVFVDAGDGRFVTYTHGRARSARVKSGDVVEAGEVLAEIGRTGTIVPHLHFDVRNRSWASTDRLRFATATGPLILREGDRATAPPAPVRSPAPFEDSRLAADTFAANGVTIDSAPLAFRWPAGTTLRWRGRAGAGTRSIEVFVWRLGQTSELTATTTPDAAGGFSLALDVPRELHGPRWYRIAARQADGSLADTATVPVWIDPAPE